MRNRTLAMAALAMLALASIGLACGKTSAAATSRNATADNITVAGHLDGNNFKLDASPAGDCKAGETCTATIRLEAVGDYHINKDYPYKFKAKEAPSIEFLGSDPAGKNVFSKGAGDFTIDGEKVGTMTVHFKPGAKGAVTVGGTYKLSVCSAQNCQLEQPDLSIGVTVK
jgi:hypothetical protein